MIQGQAVCWSIEQVSSVSNLHRRFGRRDQWKRLLRNDRCSYCGGAGGTVDHIIPRCRGGEDAVMNIAGACNGCNSRKGSRDLMTYLRLRRSHGAD